MELELSGRNALNFHFTKSHCNLFGSGNLYRYAGSKQLIRHQRSGHANHLNYCHANAQCHRFPFCDLRGPKQRIECNRRNELHMVAGWRYHEHPECKPDNNKRVHSNRRKRGLHCHPHRTGKRFTFANCNSEQRHCLRRFHRDFNSQRRNKLFMEHGLDGIKHYGYAGYNNDLHSNRHNKRMQFGSNSYRYSYAAADRHGEQPKYLRRINSNTNRKRGRYIQLEHGLSRLNDYCNTRFYNDVYRNRDYERLQLGINKYCKRYT